MVDKKINTELLARVRDHILEDERRFNMSRYVGRCRGPQAPPCGTVACIAGWAVLLTDGMPKRITPNYYEGVSERAANLLGLDEEEAYSLFHWTLWPDEFANRYAAAHEVGEEEEEDGEETPARVAAALIDSIIAAGKVEVSEDV